jgi:hypothetical protein
MVQIRGADLGSETTVEVDGVVIPPAFSNGSALDFELPVSAGQNPGFVEIVAVNGTARSAPIQLEVVDAVRFSTVSGRARTGCALSVDGDAYCWSDGVETPQLGGVNIPRKLAGGIKFTSLGANPFEGCGLTAAGTVYCFPTSGAQPTPVLKPTPVFVSLSVGSNEKCGLTSDGETWCWNNGESPTARRITNVPAFTKISSGIHQCGLTADGTAHCWGPSDSRGQLGAAPGTPQPVTVSSTIKFSHISAGQVHTCAVATTGASYCWGDNQYGELGADDGTPHTGPVQVSTTLTFTSIIAGNLMSCGMTAVKDAYCWGSNTSDILGTGVLSSSKPTTAVRHFKVISLSSGDGLSQSLGSESTTCVVSDKNNLYCWGFDVGATPRRLDPAMPH